VGLEFVAGLAGGRVGTEAVPVQQCKWSWALATARIDPRRRAAAACVCLEVVKCRAVKLRASEVSDNL
jgi:hypothetical protein